MLFLAPSVVSGTTEGPAGLGNCPQWDTAILPVSQEDHLKVLHLTAHASALVCSAGNFMTLFAINHCLSVLW